MWGFIPPPGGESYKSILMQGFNDDGKLPKGNSCKDIRKLNKERKFNDCHKICNSEASLRILFMAVASFKIIIN